MVEAAPTFPEVATVLARRLHGSILIAHNLRFDTRMLGYEFDRLGVAFNVGSGLCTLRATGELSILGFGQLAFRQLDSNGTARVGGGHRGVTEIVRSLESTMLSVPTNSPQHRSATSRRAPAGSRAAGSAASSARPALPAGGRRRSPRHPSG